MRRRLTLLTLPLLVVGLLVSRVSAQAPSKTIDLSGKWNVVMELSIGTSNPVLILKQDGDKITMLTCYDASFAATLDAAGYPAELQGLVLSLNGTFARLASAFERLTTFSGDLAHELRTPLQTLRGGVEGLLLRGGRYG